MQEALAHAEQEWKKVARQQQCDQQQRSGQSAPVDSPDRDIRYTTRIDRCTSHVDRCTSHVDRYTSHSTFPGSISGVHSSVNSPNSPCNSRGDRCTSLADRCTSHGDRFASYGDRFTSHGGRCPSNCACQGSISAAHSAVSSPSRLSPSRSAPFDQPPRSTRKAFISPSSQRAGSHPPRPAQSGTSSLGVTGRSSSTSPSNPLRAPASPRRGGCEPSLHTRDQLEIALQAEADGRRATQVTLPQSNEEGSTLL